MKSFEYIIRTASQFVFRSKQNSMDNDFKNEDETI